MVRRVIVDLMLALFATLFALAVASHDDVGKEPLSQNFLLVTSRESLEDRKQNALEILSPDGRIREASVYPGFPEDENDLGPKVYVVFPASPGRWNIRANSTATIVITTRSGKDPAVQLGPGQIRPKEVQE